MPTLAEAFALAVQHHQAGHLGQAEQLYREILRIHPHHADAHHLLGVIAYQCKQYDLAMASIRHAISLNPATPVYYGNLGVVQEASGRLDDALASLQQALRLQPLSAEAHNAVGNALRSMGRMKEAGGYFAQALRIRPAYPEAHNSLGDLLFLEDNLADAILHYQQALLLRPEWAETHCNLGNALCRQGRLEEAVLHCEEALRIRPDHAAAHNNLANALRSQGKLEDAVSHCRQALNSRPDFPEALQNLGTSLAELGRAEEAILTLREALRLNPEFTEAWGNLGNALMLKEQFDEAVRCLQRAIDLNPKFVEAYANLGYCQVQQGRFDEGQACYHRALSRNPYHADTHFNQALLWLLQGQWELGWPEYEWRWQTKDFPRYRLPQPRWDGSMQPEQTILLIGEQGLGDTIQFLRYAPLVRKRVGRVVFQCQPPLVNLLANFPGVDQLVPRGTSVPAFDTYLPLLSLPGVFGTSPAIVPAEVPYLEADPELVEKWAQKMASRKRKRLEKENLLVGIAWQGNPTFRGDRQRSIPLEQFEKLARVDCVRLISLQKRHSARTPARCDESAVSMLDFGDQLDTTAGAFMDTAAIMKNLDLVITSDTAVAHLAGALSVPVWVALPFVPDWRWQLRREDSPWYPTMRLFRQTRYGDWEEVFHRIAEELRRFALLTPDS